MELGAVASADEALRRAESSLWTTPSNERQHARMLVRRARLHRLAGRLEQARQALDQAGRMCAPDALAPERIVWFVESTLVTVQPLLAVELQQLSSDTGVAIPRWERSLLSRPSA